MGAVRLTIIAAVITGLAAGFSYMTSKFSQPNYALLYSNLDMEDAGKIVSKIETMGINAEIRGGGTEVYVPSNDVARLRMEMAEVGLPRGGSIGYEIFDKSEAFGTSSFVQDINRLRALEGEIARSIATISQVSKARVLLVLPRRELFSRERQEPSASVVLSLKGPGTLSPEKVRAIQQMVAAAVPSLTTDRVSIVDDRGNLLASGDNSGDIMSATNLEEMRLSMENRLSRVIETLVEKYVGPGHARAEVAVDMNLDRVVENSENYDPNGQVARSTQTVTDEEQSKDTSANSAAGTANQVPQGQATAANTGSSSANKRSEEIVNYEVSKTLRSVTKGIGAINRLSVAVMIDGKYTTPKGGGEPVYEPRSKEEIAKLTTLVKNAIGFDAKRGDSVEVVNMEFAQLPEGGAVAEAPGIFSMTHIDIVRLVEVVIIGLVALLILLLVIKPLIIRILESFGQAPVGAQALPDATGTELVAASKEPSTPSQQGDDKREVAEQIDKMISMQQVEGQIRESTLKQINTVIEDKPGEAVAIVREWMNEKESA